MSRFSLLLPNFSVDVDRCQRYLPMTQIRFINLDLGPFLGSWQLPRALANSMMSDAVKRSKYVYCGTNKITMMANTWAIAFIKIKNVPSTAFVTITWHEMIRKNYGIVTIFFSQILVFSQAFMKTFGCS